MCDYSLHHVASRPAKVQDRLAVTKFPNSITRGFAAVEEPQVAVCLLPGTEIAFEDDVQCQPALGIFLPAASGSGWPASGRSTCTSPASITTRSSFRTDRSCW